MSCSQSAVHSPGCINKRCCGSVTDYLRTPIRLHLIGRHPGNFWTRGRSWPRTARWPVGRLGLGCRLLPCALEASLPRAQQRVFQEEIAVQTVTACEPCLLSWQSRVRPGAALGRCSAPRLCFCLLAVGGVTIAVHGDSPILV